MNGICLFGVKLFQYRKIVNSRTDEKPRQRGVEFRSVVKYISRWRRGDCARRREWTRSVEKSKGIIRKDGSSSGSQPGRVNSSGFARKRYSRASFQRYRPLYMTLAEAREFIPFRWRSRATKST